MTNAPDMKKPGSRGPVSRARWIRSRLASVWCLPRSLPRPGRRHRRRRRRRPRHRPRAPGGPAIAPPTTAPVTAPAAPPAPAPASSSPSAASPAIAPPAAPMAPPTSAPGGPPTAAPTAAPPSAPAPAPMASPPLSSFSGSGVVVHVAIEVRISFHICRSFQEIRMRIERHRALSAAAVADATISASGLACPSPPTGRGHCESEPAQTP